MRGCVCVCCCELGDGGVREGGERREGGGVWVGVGGGGCWNNERNGGVCFAELICLHVWWGWERARVFEG